MASAFAPDIPAVIPLFPLPEHVLLPASPTPYRICEAGHRQMVLELLDHPADERWLAVPRLTEQGAAAPGDEAAPFHRVATVGLMTLATPLANGDYLIVVDGRATGHIDEVDAPFAPYRVGRPTLIEDDIGADGAASGPTTVDLIQALGALLEALGPQATDLPVAFGAIPAGPLVDYRVAAAVLDGADARQALLEERDPARRRAIVYDALVERLAAASREATSRQARANEASR